LPASADEDHAALRAATAREAALCTIVGIEGSFSRRLGAQLAIAPDGTTVGSLSDGCLERELATQAAAARADGRPRLLRYGRGSPFIDFRLPCGSGLDIWIDPAPDQTALAEIVTALDRREAATLSLGLPIDRSDLLQQRQYLPSPRVIALGAGPEAEWLARLAESFGASCEIAGPNAGLTLGQAPDHLAVDHWTAIVLLFHDHEWEDALLDWALTTPAFYIGALGGAVARENRHSHLATKGHASDQIARIRSPIGLIPQARDARTLALSVMAEVVTAYECLRR
jgi:xanthine dehydrogenase accessory factor